VPNASRPASARESGRTRALLVRAVEKAYPNCADLPLFRGAILRLAAGARNRDLTSPAALLTLDSRAPHACREIFARVTSGLGRPIRIAKCSVEFPGHMIAILATDTEIGKRSGIILVTPEVAQGYGVTGVDRKANPSLQPRAGEPERCEGYPDETRGAEPMIMATRPRRDKNEVFTPTSAAPVSRSRWTERQPAVVGVAYDDQNVLVALSVAEGDVATLVAAGLTNAAIADRRGTSVRTVANQMASIFRKTGAGSRKELAARIALQASKRTTG
jgi:DNA-binding CsgD family transcriptional regulator